MIPYENEQDYLNDTEAEGLAEAEFNAAAAQAEAEQQEAIQLEILRDAAPDLLEALQDLQKWHHKYPTGKTYSYDMIGAIEGELTAIVNKGIEAIKKATIHP
jgi:hypothetical protein